MDPYDNLEAHRDHRDPEDNPGYYGVHGWERPWGWSDEDWLQNVRNRKNYWEVGDIKRELERTGVRLRMKYQSTTAYDPTTWEPIPMDQDSFESMRVAFDRGVNLPVTDRYRAETEGKEVSYHISLGNRSVFAAPGAQEMQRELRHFQTTYHEWQHYHFQNVSVNQHSGVITLLADPLPGHEGPHDGIARRLNALSMFGSQPKAKTAHISMDTE
jgi:hypothetical protein